MRNLKKFLALVLAMVMAFSLMLSAGAVSYSDYDDKDEIVFDEAVKVLTGLKVFTGDEDASGVTKFRPKDFISRAEAAAVMYRVITGDVSGTQVPLYTDYGTGFKDVKADDWFSGYVAFCKDAGIIKGTSPTSFSPYVNVTGYEMLAMLLRAVGYGKNNEFTGGDWYISVAQLAESLHITDEVKKDDFNFTLSKDATREIVAELAFVTMTKVPTVTFTTALQYNDKENITSTRFNPTLGQKIFGLYVENKWIDVDKWGRPGYQWYSGGKFNNTYTGVAYYPVGGGAVVAPTNNAYDNPIGHPIYSGGSVVATIEMPYSYSFHDTMLECDVAAELKIETEHTFDLYVNGDNDQQRTGIQFVTDKYRIVANDTVTKVGGTGRLTDVYYKVESKWLSSPYSCVVMIDTMLAQVTNVTPANLDRNDHVITPAKMEVTIYDGGVTNAPAGNNGSSKRIISKPSSSKDNWEYSKGDMILIHANTNKGTRDNNQALEEAAAFQTDPVIGTDSPTTTLTQGTNVWVVKKADSITGKQTMAYSNANKHQIDGQDKPDQLELFLDRAGRATNTTFTWWLDEYQNIIGITDSVATFGVITSIYAAIGQGESDTNGRVKAMANVKYADGTTSTIAIDKFLMSTTAASAADVKTTAGTKSTDENEQLTTTKSTVELWPRFESTNAGAYNPALTVSVPTVNLSASNDAQYQGFLYLAPSTVTNDDAHFNNTRKYEQDSYGILFDHMFQFAIASDNSVVAIEVAGDTAPATPNQGLYANKYNNLAGSTVDQNGKIFKNLSYMVLKNDNAAAGGTAGTINTVYLDNDTQIMVYNGSRAVSTYNGVSDLPGDVTLALGSEVDWADTDGDGRANYVYVTGTIPGVVTYNLFYNNGGAAQWNGTTGTIAGYLDGKAETVTFANYNMYDIVNNSANYEGHLFALQITNGVVTSVMYAESEDANNNWGQMILADYTTAGVPTNESGTVLKFDDGTTAQPGTVNHISTLSTEAGATATAGSEFKTGTANGNTYTVSTEAVYWHDSVEVNVANGYDNVAYERVSQGNRIVVSGAHNVEYWIAPSCDIVVNNVDSDISGLDLLNMRECDVTMVYEAGSINSVIQLYITTDPDVTPTEPGAGTVRGNRPYGTCVSFPTTAANLTSALKSGVRNTVLFSNVLSNDATINTNLGVTGVTASELMYFPFTCENGTAATLEIRDQFGTLVYGETSAALSDNGLDGSTSGTAHAFVINFRNSAANANTSNDLPLLITDNNVEMTYTFTIYTTNATGNVVLSTGSFGMN